MAEAFRQWTAGRKTPKNLEKFVEKALKQIQKEITADALETFKGVKSDFINMLIQEAKKFGIDQLKNYGMTGGASYVVWKALKQDPKMEDEPLSSTQKRQVQQLMRAEMEQLHR
jgi:hypothetical protein